MAAQSSNRECPKDGATTTTTTKESSSTNNEGRPRSKSYQYYSTRKDGSNKMFTNQYLITLLLTAVPLIALFLITTPIWKNNKISPTVEKQCYRTCKLQIVESIPENITFVNATLPQSTFYAWNRLIENAENDLAIAAYKSSLQGKHVLGSLASRFSSEGDSIFESIMNAGTKNHVNVKIVENYPPKDKGDNADGVILQNYGAVKRRSLDIEQVMGRGKMHSKFLMADKKSFYLGSANLDWRSLNQKMELGVYVENCECLGQDLQSMFDTYWYLPTEKRQEILSTTALYNMERPLNMKIDGEKSQVYIASSPKELNNRDRTWDLDAIVNEINNAQEFLDIHVMDYFPLFVYRKPREHFPMIDDALRQAIVRGVRVRILAAALHYPAIGTRFLKSLESLNQMSDNASVQVKIFKVPTTYTENIVINRERRTHNKFMVTESSCIIGTSNWSGDYFIGGTTGAAIVVKQFGARRPLVAELKGIFDRDWDSEYAHPLTDYYNLCILSNDADYCETTKDPRLFASPDHVE